MNLFATLAAFICSLVVGTISAGVHASDSATATIEAAFTTNGAPGCSHDHHGDAADEKAGHHCDSSCAHHWAALLMDVPSFVNAMPTMPSPSVAVLSKRASFFLPLRPPAV